MMLRILQRFLDRLAPPDGPGSFRIWGVPSGKVEQPWWPDPEDDPDAIERAAMDAHWDEDPDKRSAMLHEAARLRD